MSSIEDVGGTVSGVAQDLPLPELSGVVEVFTEVSAEVAALSAGSDAAELDTLVSSLISTRDHAASALTALTGARTSLLEYVAAIGAGGKEAALEEMSVLVVAQSAPVITSAPGSRPEDRLQAAELRLRQGGVLTGDTLVTTMTVGEYVEQVDRYAEYVLLSLEPEETGAVAPPSGIGDVLAPLNIDARALAVDRIIARLGDTPCYQLFTPGVVRLVTETLRVAPPRQSFELTTMMSDSVRTTSELRAISGTLLPEMLGLTESVLHYQHPANRERANINDEHYARLLATAGSVFDMFARASYSNQFLRIDKMNMLEKVRQLVRPDAKRI